jgi:membrane protein implicated in regulation of membrane protease activity
MYSLRKVLYDWSVAMMAGFISGALVIVAVAKLPLEQLLLPIVFFVVLGLVGTLAAWRMLRKDD